jgi:hypothetical protein
MAIGDLNINRLIYEDALFIIVYCLRRGTRYPVTLFHHHHQPINVPNAGAQAFLMIAHIRRHCLILFNLCDEVKQ